MSSALFSGFDLRGLALENRTVISPMCQYSAVDGSAQDWHLMHLGQFAVAGVGLVITEAAAVEPAGRITGQCLGLYSDENEQALARVVAFCKQHGSAKLGIQLAHAGRKASVHRPWDGRHPLSESQGAWDTFSSSAEPHDEGWSRPSALDADGMARVKQAFVDAAVRADRIGLDLIELHAAHGYLMHEFLSPVANRRNDAYGGPLENRMRFALEVFDAVRAVWPEEKPIGVRLSATDWIDGAWNVDEAVTFSSALREHGCDFIVASSGGISEQQKIVLGEGYQVAFASRIRREAQIPTMAVGMIFEPAHAEQLVADGEADMIALARGFLFDPHWAWSAAAALGAQITAPPQYARAADFRFLREKRGQAPQ